MLNISIEGFSGPKKRLDYDLFKYIYMCLKNIISKIYTRTYYTSTYIERLIHTHNMEKVYHKQNGI